MYTKSLFDKMEQIEIPEIKRSSLTAVVLQMVASGITDPVRFDFMEPPAEEALTHAQGLLLSVFT